MTEGTSMIYVVGENVSQRLAQHQTSNFRVPGWMTLAEAA